MLCGHERVYVPSCDKIPKKVRVFWGTPERHAYGNALGYATHNSQMLKHTLPFIENTTEAKIILQIISADQFTPVPDRVNVLFTMWEFIDVPKSYQENLAKADYVIVPSRFCRDIFAPYCERKPIVCFEGVDEEVFKPVERVFTKGGKFKCLWIGAPNPRKGYQTILNVINIAEKVPQIEFYLKTTVKAITFPEFVRNTIKHWKRIVDVKSEKRGIETLLRIFRRLPNRWNAGKVFVYGKHKNVKVDTRRISIQDLIKLYHESHLFLFPTLGEGWGLTLCEAMATGLPCIAVSQTGCKDFFDESVGYAIKNSVGDLGEIENYSMKSCRSYIPDTTDFFEKMMHVISNYDEALKRGERASWRVRNKFTWKQAGKRLSEILEQIAQEQEIV
jgi:glycosyltransferase involved in cell wall biosynthesis